MRAARNMPGYVEQEARLFDGHLIATGGFRVDGNSQFGKEVSPAWSVAIPLQQYGLTLRGSYSEGFRAPSFNELYLSGLRQPESQPGNFIGMGRRIYQDLRRER